MSLGSARTYTSLRFDAAAARADAWSDALLDAGALAVDLSDPHAGGAAEVAVYAEPGTAGMLWPLSRVSALFAPGTDAEAALLGAAQALGESLPLAERYEVPDQDWVRATQAQFGPIDVGDGLWVVPSWCARPAQARIAVRLDPGLAFGTGSHPTTRLCLAWLAEHLRPGRTVLDYGCGSGILAIAAALLGAGDATGTDIDPQAIAASTANARANAVAARFVLPGDLPAGASDIVVANILANPLVLLAPLLAMRVREAGRIALSGILDAQAADVAAAYTPWFNIAPWRSVEGWVLLSGERRAAGPAAGVSAQ